MKTISLAFWLFVAACLCPLHAADAPLHWIPLAGSQFEIDGLPWYGENGGELFRLPAKLKDTYRQPVWELAEYPSGGRIRFRTN